MTDKRLPPVAVCTGCGAHSYSAPAINQPCARMIGGKRCRGVYGSTLGTKDWDECRTCQGTGRFEQGQCLECEGCGWIFVRR